MEFFTCLCGHPFRVSKYPGGYAYWSSSTNGSNGVWGRIGRGQRSRSAPH